MKRACLAALCCAAATVILGCGGGGGNKDKTATAAATTVAKASVSPLTTKTTLPGASPQASGTAGTAGSVTAGTPAPEATTGAGTPVAGSTDAVVTPSPADTPQPAATEGPGGGQPTVSETDAALAESVPADTLGGNPADPAHVVSVIPPPPSGYTPVVDSKTIAPPDPPNNDLQVMVDLDASKPGIQSTREVHVGDVFRVGIVAVGVPVYQTNLGGFADEDLYLNYDKTKMIAPTIQGGPTTDRNPDLNTPALGGDSVRWACLPAAQGDLDDPGAIDGDGDPDTGQAFLTCFTPLLGHESGNLVIATVEFHATASGTSNLFLNHLRFGDAIGIIFASCAGDGEDIVVPCVGATLTVS